MLMIDMFKRKFNVSWKVLVKKIDSKITNVGDYHTCKKREIPEIYLRKFVWIFRKILG